MSFTFGISAVQELRQYMEYPNNGNGTVIRAIDLEWFFKSMLPALVILAIVNITTSVAVRIRSIVASK
jgi:hypothetical protein